MRQWGLQQGLAEEKEDPRNPLNPGNFKQVLHYESATLYMYLDLLHHHLDSLNPKLISVLTPGGEAHP